MDAIETSLEAIERRLDLIDARLGLSERAQAELAGPPEGLREAVSGRRPAAWASRVPASLRIIAPAGRRDVAGCAHAVPA